MEMNSGSSEEIGASGIARSSGRRHAMKKPKRLPTKNTAPSRSSGPQRHPGAQFRRILTSTSRQAAQDAPMTSDFSSASPEAHYSALCADFLRRGEASPSEKKGFGSSALMAN